MPKILTLEPKIEQNWNHKKKKNPQKVYDTRVGNSVHGSSV